MTLGRSGSRKVRVIEKNRLLPLIGFCINAWDGGVAAGEGGAGDRPGKAQPYRTAGALGAGKWPNPNDCGLVPHLIAPVLYYKTHRKLKRRV